jgi:beta-xylosidase
MIRYPNQFYILCIMFYALLATEQQSATQEPHDYKVVPAISKVWISDNGNGTYTNPVLHADYSDPDVVRVDSDYYMTASSFQCIPGLPILHSRDLVNWELISYALTQLPPYDIFSKPQHGCGVWAPCIRYHAGIIFYIFYPDPDYGIYMVKAENPQGPWSVPLLIKAGKGLIDPTPLWDDDGSAYLAYAFAGSRAGIKSILVVCTMTADASKVNDDEVLVFDGHEKHNTVEGPKFYKRNGYYYLFAPAGGVAPGWQLVLRSRNVLGPYQEKVVMAQGKTSINGPHQGAWVTTVTGEDWFLHFQDKGAYGRVVHLNPMVWKNDWPVIGIDEDGDGCGEPVTTYKKPDVGKKYAIQTPPENDEFNSPKIGLQWQWHANKHISWGFPSGNLGFFRLNCIPKPEGYKNLWDVSNLLLQKLPAEEFVATCKLLFTANFDLEEAGLVVMGIDYANIALKRENGKLYLLYTECMSADQGGKEQNVHRIAMDNNLIYLQVKVSKGAVCNFAYSINGKNFIKFGNTFIAKPGRWIGAKIGFFALREGIINNAGYVNIDWFRIDPI